MTYLELKESLRGTGLKSMAEYKVYAKEQNEKLGKTVFYVSPDLKYKKDGTWVSTTDMLEFTNDGFVEEKKEEVVSKDEDYTFRDLVNDMISEEETISHTPSEEDDVVNTKGAIILDENLDDTDNNVIGREEETENYSKEWGYLELKVYIANMFTKLVDYKNWARSENNAGKLHRGKKLPISPDIYFKDRGTWENTNDFLSLTSPKEDELKDNSKLAEGLEKLEKVINDEPVETVVKSKPIANYETKEVPQLDKLEKVIGESLMRLDAHTFKEIPLKDVDYSKDKVSITYNALKKILVAQTAKKSYTNVTYYDKVSSSGRSVKAHLLVSYDQNQELKVLLYNSKNPDTEFTDKEIKDIVKRILQSKSVLCKNGKRLSIFDATEYIEKNGITTYMFFLESSYTVFIDKDFNWDV